MNNMYNLGLLAQLKYVQHLLKLIKYGYGVFGTLYLEWDLIFAKYRRYSSTYRVDIFAVADTKDEYIYTSKDILPTLFTSR